MPQQDHQREQRQAEQPDVGKTEEIEGGIGGHVDSLVPAASVARAVPAAFKSSASASSRRLSAPFHARPSSANGRTAEGGRCSGAQRSASRLSSRRTRSRNSSSGRRL